MILPYLTARFIEYPHLRGHWDLKRKKKSNYKSRSMISIISDWLPRLTSA